jgi:hypothetical protein
MAIVRKMEKIQLERDTTHSEVQSTYSIVQDASGQRYLQIDTYGSVTREMPGKKSQSIRLSPEALEQLREIIESNFS